MIKIFNTKSGDNIMSCDYGSYDIAAGKMKFMDYGGIERGNMTSDIFTCYQNNEIYTIPTLEVLINGK